jgi:hypothetical protein
MVSSGVASHSPGHAGGGVAADLAAEPNQAAPDAAQDKDGLKVRCCGCTCGPLLTPTDMSKLTARSDESACPSACMNLA